MESGTVTLWLDEEGWGVIDSLATPGGCWVHFTAVVVEGYRALLPGIRVMFTFEPADQDGYAFRAIEVWPADRQPDRVQKPTTELSGAYQSTLTITRDDGTVLSGDAAHQFIRRAQPGTDE